MRRLWVLSIAMLLSGCTPGLILSLYNTTGSVITVTNPSFRRVVTIPPNTAADVGISGEVLVQGSGHTWTYSSGSVSPPASLFEKHGMLWRAFGKIDTRGYIYIRMPSGSPQPAGFPVKPRKT
jgi:hypothetical protein